MQILNHHQIQTKVSRLAIEILENNLLESEIILAGINTSGYIVAEMLFLELQKKNLVPVHLTRISLNPATPLSAPVLPEEELHFYEDKCIIVVDDVANTGRTIFYACKPFLDVLPKKVEVAVLVDRSHKLFPIRVDYKGISLATTFQEHIAVQLKNAEALSVDIT